jgi:hypothetical protein
LSFTSTEGGSPAQIQALFAQINKEYNVVRRHRNPVADAAARQREIPRPERRPLVRRPPRRVDENGVPLDGHESPIDSFKGHNEREHWHGRHETGEHRSRHDHRASRVEDYNEREKRHAPPKKEEKGHKSRVSFDLPSVRTDDTDDENNTPSRGGSARTTLGERNEVYEICRRLWEMSEVMAEVAG